MSRKSKELELIYPLTCNNAFDIELYRQQVAIFCAKFYHRHIILILHAKIRLSSILFYLFRKLFCVWSLKQSVDPLGLWASCQTFLSEHRKEILVLPIAVSEVHILLFGSNTPFWHLCSPIVLFNKQVIQQDVQVSPETALSPSGRPTQEWCTSEQGLHDWSPLIQ